MTSTDLQQSKPESFTLILTPYTEQPVIDFIGIPAGKFLMGSPLVRMSEVATEGPQHEVVLQSFYLSRTPITQAQWREVASWSTINRNLNPDPSGFKGPNRPVERVSWYDAMEFCARLSSHTGITYTLPSESQWEYACRSGSTMPFAFGDTLAKEQAQFDATETCDVGIFPANAWGLHDMHGNVWEWCLDHWHDTYEGAPEDGGAWLDEKAPVNAVRLLRGGSWINDPQDCRSAYRGRNHPDGVYDDFGFRICCPSLS